jgi:uncharacterized RDD family membrane protein YckC
MTAWRRGQGCGRQDDLMDWYYANGQEQVGPVDDVALEALARSGAVTPETLVWRAGMGDWRPYGEVAAEPGLASPPPPRGAIGEGTAICAECGMLFSVEDMVQYSGTWVCAVCKPVFFQRLREGGAIPGQLAYAGFWIRLGAYIIDSIILSLASGAVRLASGMGFTFESTTSPMWFLSMSVMSLVGLVISMGYETWFVGRFGATPGKMACGLKVVRPDGGAVTYGRAFGRFWGKFLSGVILYIGFIMIGFDEEKRGLHDRLCDTRVVRR